MTCPRPEIAPTVGRAVLFTDTLTRIDTETVSRHPRTATRSRAGTLTARVYRPEPLGHGRQAVADHISKSRLNP